MSQTSLYIKNGNTFSVAPKGSLNVQENLPAQTYVLKLDPQQGYYLEIVEDFSMPPKIYGNTLAMTKRVLCTFSSRKNSTGVLLVGDKGSGKTLLAKSISLTGLQQGVPTIVVNSPFQGDPFNSFIQSIGQPCIIIFDEFEKTYKAKDQEHILTLLDGVFQSKKLFILTSNDKHKIDPNMQNRPGRIFYLFNFKGLDEEFIREYCADNLEDQSKTEELVKVSTLFDSFNFDLLCAFVEEINRYGDNPRDLVDLINARPEYCDGMEYEESEVYFRDLRVPLKSFNTSDLDSFNMSNDYFHGQIFITYDRDSEDVKRALKLGEDEFDIWYNLLKSGKAKFKSEMIKASNNYIEDRLELKDNNLGVHVLRCCVGPEDVIEYRGSGAVYKDEEGVIIFIKKAARNKKKKQISSLFSYMPNPGDGDDDDININDWLDQTDPLPEPEPDFFGVA